MLKKLRAVLAALLLACLCAGVLVACGGGTKDLAEAEIELSQTTYVYDGTAHTPDVTVKLGGKTLNNADLAIAYSDNVDAGTATVTVIGTPQSSYTGSKSANYTILQAESARAETEKEVYLNAVYGQKLGDVLAGKYNIASSEEGLTEDTVLEKIGEKAYTFISIYTPTDTNYASWEQTVYISVAKAQPDGVKDLEALTATVGDSYEDLELPEGIALMPDEEGKVFGKAGAVEIKVKAQQIVNGVPDTEHYEEIENLTATVNVERAKYELIEGYDEALEYDSIAFRPGEDGTHTVNGEVNFEAYYYMYKDWEFSITLSRVGLQKFTLNLGFTNALETTINDPTSSSTKTLIQNSINKDIEFDFETGKIRSYLGSFASGYDYDSDSTTTTNSYKDGTSAGSTDYRWLPERIMSATGNITIYVKAWIDPATQTTRQYRVYVGLEGETVEDGMIELFSRNTTKTYPVRIYNMAFVSTDEITVKDVAYSESYYGNDKLVGENKLQKFMTDGHIDEQYTEGGLLMIGDSLVDYWGLNMGASSADCIVATQNMFKGLGYDGPVINLGIGGSTAEGWLNYLETAKEYFTQFNPDAVFMLIGCNQVTSEDEINISEYIIMLIEKVRALYPDAEIIVNSLMPVTATHATRYAVWTRLANANQIVKAWIESSEDGHVNYLDVETLFCPDPTQPISENNLPLQSAGYYHTDGLHFLQAAYEKWTPKVVELLAQIGLVTRTTVNLEVVDEEGAVPSGILTMSYTAYNGHIIMTIGLKSEVTNGIYYKIVKLELGGVDVTAYYDAKTKSFIYDFDGEIPEEITLKVTLETMEDPNDNVVDDDNFQ